MNVCWRLHAGGAMTHLERTVVSSREESVPGVKTHLKGIVHSKILILSLFTHPHVIPNPCAVILSVEHRRHFRCFSSDPLVFQ